jgi:hypothetical protein
MTLIERLDRVHECGPGRWIARCPAHEDKNPSLSLRELDDGRILLHCFAGCATADVLAAVGLSMADLFPDRLPDLRPAKDHRHLHAAREALKALHRDVLLVAIAAEDTARGVVLDDTDRRAVIEAASRIRAAVEIAA